MRWLGATRRAARGSLRCASYEGVAAGTWLRRSCTVSVALWTEWKHILTQELIDCGSATSHTSSALCENVLRSTIGDTE
jgi:hypothetical protein